MNHCDRASALRNECARLEACEQRMRKSREEAEALIKEWLEDESYPGELADELRETTQLRDQCRQLENRHQADRITLATLAAAADQPF